MIVHSESIDHIFQKFLNIITPVYYVVLDVNRYTIFVLTLNLTSQLVGIVNKKITRKSETPLFDIQLVTRKTI